MSRNESKKKLIIMSNIPDENGWLPINYMIELFVKTLNIHITRQEDVTASKFQKFKALIGNTRTRDFNAPNLLIIVRSMGDLDGLVYKVRKNKSKYNKVAVWVIDSFWHDRISKFPFNKYVDNFFVMTKEDVAFYESKTGVPTTFLGWGADALLLGADNSNRKIDLLRIGRQPECWNDDTVNEKLLSENNLIYQGRPPESEQAKEPFDCSGYIELVKNYYSHAKFVLAQSNFADTSIYTHPSREYITARWTDAIASGCVVIGCQPLTCSTYSSFDYQATVHIQDFENKTVFIEKISQWKDTTPKANYHMALQNLDWRWKFLIILNTFDLVSEELNQDLTKINNILLKN